MFFAPVWVSLIGYWTIGDFVFSNVFSLLLHDQKLNFHGDPWYSLNQPCTFHIHFFIKTMYASIIQSKFFLCG